MLRVGGKLAGFDVGKPGGDVRRLIVHRTFDPAGKETLEQKCGDQHAGQ